MAALDSWPEYLAAVPPEKRHFQGGAVVPRDVYERACLTATGWIGNMGFQSDAGWLALKPEDNDGS